MWEYSFVLTHLKTLGAYKEEVQLEDYNTNAYDNNTLG